MLLLALAPFAAVAQDASQEEQAVLSSIAQCMVSGLPQDWQRAEMNVVLAEPGAQGGEVTYRMSRVLAGAEEPFRPCDERKPPAFCHQCGQPADTHVNCANDGCHLLFIQCEN